MIQEGVIEVNNLPAQQMQRVMKHEAVSVNGICVQESITFQYIAFYKPRGIECTLNPDVPDNLLTVINFSEHLFPIGRLDKESEGLLILTNDGKLYNQISNIYDSKNNLTGHLSLMKRNYNIKKL